MFIVCYVFVLWPADFILGKACLIPVKIWHFLQQTQWQVKYGASSWLSHWYFWAVRIVFFQWDFFCILNIVSWWSSWSLLKPLVIKKKCINSISSLLRDREFKQHFCHCPQNSVPVNAAGWLCGTETHPTSSLPLDIYSQTWLLQQVFPLWYHLVERVLVQHLSVKNTMF